LVLILKYVDGQLGGEFCAYDLPGGTLSMQFLPESSIISVDDG
jgi:hypothetical protein